MTDIAITLAGPEHVADCVEAVLNSALGDVYYAHRPPADIAASFESGIRKGEIHVAKSDGACIGFIWFTDNGAFYKFPFVRLLAVRREFRGQGVGRQLLGYFESHAFQKAPKVFMLVSDFNTRARDLYHRLGYTVVGCIEDYSIAGVAEFILMKTR